MHQLNQPNQPVGRATNTGFRSLARRYSRSILLSAAVTLGGSVLAIGMQMAPAAALATGCHTVVTNGSPLNLRSGPNSNSAIVASIAKGSTVNVLSGGENGWVRVRTNITQGTSTRSVEGWMASSFLRPCAVVRPPSACRVVATNTLPLNIRSRADDDAPILGTIAKGRTLEVIGSNSNGWVRVRATVMTGGATRTVEGWAASSFLRPCTTAQNPQNPTPIPAALCRRVIYNEGLSVHEKPDLASNRTGGVPLGDQVQLVNQESTATGGAVWMQINRPVSGWIPVRSLNRPANQLNVLNCL